MADTHTPGSAAAGIDLTQFYQVFFEEAGENLATMEQMLLGLDLTRADDEELNAIFRCAHSVKGGAATFGFADVAELTHQMETLLDKLRRHELAPTAAMVDVLLQSGDALRAQLARHQGVGGAAVDTHDLLASIRAMVAGQELDPLLEGRSDRIECGRESGDARGLDGPDAFGQGDSTAGEAHDGRHRRRQLGDRMGFGPRAGQQGL